jgi:hypothetical protein
MRKIILVGEEMIWPFFSLVHTVGYDVEDGSLAGKFPPNNKWPCLQKMTFAPLPVWLAVRLADE